MKRSKIVLAIPSNSWWNTGGLYTTYCLEAKRVVPTDRDTHFHQPSREDRPFHPPIPCLVVYDLLRASLTELLLGSPA